jgi:molybdopterin-synthase adenylyltransferase
MPDRYDRHLGLFGAAGQRRISETVAGIVGYGGIGAQVGQQLAYLGVRRFRIFEHDMIDETSLNRLVGASPSDVGLPKIDIATRVLRSVQPEAEIRAVPHRLGPDSASLLQDATVVFGCVDRDDARVQLLAYLSELGIPYFDTATDTGETETGVPWYGGRVATSLGDGCLMCMDVLDARTVAEASMTGVQRETQARLYGVPVDQLDRSGPSVVSVNGIIASLAVTEFMVYTAGLRAPQRVLTYRGERGVVSVDATAPQPDCYYCARFRAVDGASRAS